MDEALSPRLSLTLGELLKQRSCPLGLLRDVQTERRRVQKSERPQTARAGQVTRATAQQGTEHRERASLRASAALRSLPRGCALLTGPAGQARSAACPSAPSSARVGSSSASHPHFHVVQLCPIRKDTGFMNQECSLTKQSGRNRFHPRGFTSCAFKKLGCWRRLNTPTHCSGQLDKC